VSESIAEVKEANGVAAEKARKDLDSVTNDGTACNMSCDAILFCFFCVVLCSRGTVWRLEKRENI
jgi:hypothetical protein